MSGQLSMDEQVTVHVRHGYLGQPMVTGRVTGFDDTGLSLSNSMWSGGAKTVGSVEYPESGDILIPWTSVGFVQRVEVGRT